MEEKKIEGKQLICPHCGNGSFERRMREVVTMWDTGECIQDEVVKAIETTYCCQNCGEDVTEMELTVEL